MAGGQGGGWPGGEAGGASRTWVTKSLRNQVKFDFVLGRLGKFTASLN